LKKIYKVCLFLIVLTICALLSNSDHRPNHYVINNKFHSILYIDYKFSNQEKEYITNAAFDWERATNRIVTFDIIYLPTIRTIDLDKGLLILKVDSLDPEIIILDIAAKKSQMLGICQEYKSIPYIKLVSTRLDSSNYQAVVTHELGHLIGLNHTNELYTLMYPTVDFGSPTITESDMNRFCKIYSCQHTLTNQ
jgi:predicted Zn-dependent protease